ncbi:Pentatricopeptide repeat-containing protein 2, partial [Eufriesea mexicana]
MQETCDSENGIVYSEDLKAMLHLAKATDQDMDLLDKMLRKYVANQRITGFGSYRFGPAFMRMYYHLDQPKYALKAFMDPEFDDTYNYRVVYRILISLLYKHKMFDEIKSTFEHVLNTKGSTFIGSNFIIIYAVCLIENTRESMQYALKYWHYNTNTIHGPRSRAIMAALALKQNSPEMALNIINSGPVEQVISIRSLKIMTYVQLGRYIQIIPILKRVLENENSYYQAIFADAIYNLENKLDMENVPEATHIHTLIDEIKRRNLIQTGITLEEFILKPLIMKNNIQKMRDGNRRFSRQ